MNEPTHARERYDGVDWQLTIVVLVAVKNEMLAATERFALHPGFETEDKEVVKEFFLSHESVVIRVVFAVTPLPSQGGDAAALATARLAERYKPYCFAMVGICAGSRARVGLKDVIVAGATFRHDFGPLRRSWRPWGRPQIVHRGKPEQIGGRFAANLNKFVASRAATPGYRTYFGVMTSGNQVVRLDGAFKYLDKKIVCGFSGDEHCKQLYGLDMEAHAVAYAAVNSNVPLWLVVKGVADFADTRKSDECHVAAAENAYDTMCDVLRDVVVGEFISDERTRIAVDEERDASRAYAAGEIIAAAQAASGAHEKGRRTRTVRARYVNGLMQLGRYDVARRAIDAYKRTPGLYDAVTRELDATMLWRARDYVGACDAVPAEEIGGSRQLMYVRALSLVYAGESLESAAYQRGAVDNTHLDAALRLLESALAVRASKVAWWIAVNHYWVLRLRFGSGVECDNAFEAALRSVRGSRSSPKRPLYELLLLAVADRDSDFEQAVGTRSARGMQLSVDALDSVFVKLSLLANRGRLTGPARNRYLNAVFGWLRTAQTVGTMSREILESVQ